METGLASCNQVVTSDCPPPLARLRPLFDPPNKARSFWCKRTDKSKYSIVSTHYYMAGQSENFSDLFSRLVPGSEGFPAMYHRFSGSKRGRPTRGRVGQVGTPGCTDSPNGEPIQTARVSQPSATTSSRITRAISSTASMIAVALASLPNAETGALSILICENGKLSR